MQRPFELSGAINSSLRRTTEASGDLPYPRDFRRSSAVEAIAGGAKAEELAHAMSNTLFASNALFCHLCPGQHGHVADGARSGAALTKQFRTFGARGYGAAWPRRD